MAVAKESLAVLRVRERSEKSMPGAPRFERGVCLRWKRARHSSRAGLRQEEVGHKGFGEEVRCLASLSDPVHESHLRVSLLEKDISADVQCGSILFGQSDMRQHHVMPCMLRRGLMRGDEPKSGVVSAR